jgi:hypothetical protein
MITSAPTTYLNDKKDGTQSDDLRYFRGDIRVSAGSGGAFDETGDVLEFRLQLTSSNASALLPRQYGMHCLGISMRNVIIVPTYHHRRTTHNPFSYRLASRY